MKVPGPVATADDPEGAFGIEPIPFNSDDPLNIDAPGGQQGDSFDELVAQIELDAADQTAFAKALADPPEPNENLKRLMTISDAYVADIDADGKPIWRQVLFWRDGKWVEPTAL